MLPEEKLKLQGARIFTDAARIFVLAHAVAQTNTAERLRAAHAAIASVMLPTVIVPEKSNWLDE